MKQIFRLCLVLALVLLSVQEGMAQATVAYKVKKKDTIYGISRDYGISVQQLMDANPGMASPDYKLKKGDVIRIPVVEGKAGTTTAAQTRPINLGVMLPLHDNNSEGRRMVEYYRGVLMACDTLKKEGISVNVSAWNLPEDGNVSEVLQDRVASKCDIIIGPLYSKYMEALSNFSMKNNIMLVVPFSINAPQLYSNTHIFQVYQSNSVLNEATVHRCADWFRDYHPVIVDCQDATSTKGNFTSALRREFDVKGMKYNITSIQADAATFARAFIDTKPNLVILNTGALSHLKTIFEKLKTLAAAKPNVEISVFGYPDWVEYARQQKQNFHTFNVYVPSPFFTNYESPQFKYLEKKYRANFRQDMQMHFPRWAIVGYDHAVFFLRGLHKYGKSFDGDASRFGYKPVQTPLKFERVGGGGYQNRAYMFIHYKPNGEIDTINY